MFVAAILRPYGGRYGVLYVYMGWLRLVGSLKSQVSFAEYRLFYRTLLQKRPIILRSLLIVATPYEETHSRNVYTKCILEGNGWQVCCRVCKHDFAAIVRLNGARYGVVYIHTTRNRFKTCVHGRYLVSYAAAYSLFYWALLQKRPMCLGSLLI